MRGRERVRNGGEGRRCIDIEFRVSGTIFITSLCFILNALTDFVL